MKNRVAVITGGARGIGLATAKTLAKAGYDVAICSRTESELESATLEIKEFGNECYFESVDVGNEQQVKQFVENVHNKFNTIDVLVNNAGVQLNKPFLEITKDEWQQVINTNLNSVFYFCQNVGKHMTKQNSGRVINISSVLASFALPGRSPYSVSKGGMESMTRVLSSEWGKYNILVNAIQPGHVDTELIRRDINRGLINEQDMRDRSVLERVGNVEEISGLVEFLASDKASFITGQVFIADGGFSIKK